MKKRDPIVYIYDMLQYCNSAIGFIAKMNYTQFVKDEKTIFAVIKAVEVIGEASKKVSKNIKEKNTSIPWREIAGMRDKLVHEYFGVNTKIIWNTAKKDIPVLKDQLEIIFKDLNKNPALKL